MTLQKVSKAISMPKTPPLCTGAESNLKDRALGEVEEKIFITLQGKGGPQQANAFKTMPHLLGS